MNLSGTHHECCIGTLKCIADASFGVELAFSIGNGAGTAVLLLVVLFSSWLYITLNATKANTNRYREARALSERLRQEFLALQFLFSIGMILAYFGIGAVMTMKVTTRSQSWFLMFLTIIMATATAGFALKCLWEILHINKAVDKMRVDKVKEAGQAALASMKQASSVPNLKLHTNQI